MPGPKHQLRPKATCEYLPPLFRYHWYWTDIRTRSNSSTPARGLITRDWVQSDPPATVFFSYPNPGPTPIPK